MYEDGLNSCVSLFPLKAAREALDRGLDAAQIDGDSFGNAAEDPSISNAATDDASYNEEPHSDHDGGGDSPDTCPGGTRSDESCDFVFQPAFPKYGQRPKKFYADSADPCNALEIVSTLNRIRFVDDSTC